MKAKLEHLQELGISKRLKTRLEAYIREYIDVKGLEIVEIALYGGIVQGNFDPKNSDINILFILEDVSLQQLERLASITNRAWREIRLEAFILTVKDISRNVSLFPTKILSIQDSHLLVYGKEYIEDLQVDTDTLVFRIRQELQNILHRMRRRYLLDNDDSYALRMKLRQISSSFITQLRYLLSINNDNVRNISMKAVLEDAKQTIGIDDILALAALKYDDYLDETTTHKLYEQTMNSIEIIFSYIDEIRGE